MLKITAVLAAVLFALCACTTIPAPLESSALDAIDVPKTSLQGDCNAPPPGIVCIREMRAGSIGECTCIGADRLSTLGIWPASDQP